MLALMQDKLVVFATHRLHWLDVFDVVYELDDFRASERAAERAIECAIEEVPVRVPKQVTKCTATHTAGGEQAC